MILFGAIGTFVTPIWLFGMGALLGLLLISAGLAITYPISRRAAGAFVGMVREGVLLPIFYTALLLALFALLTTFMVPYGELLRSTLQLPFSGEENVTATVPADVTLFPVSIGVPASGLTEVSVTANRDVVLQAPEASARLERIRVPLVADRPHTWNKGSAGRQLFMGDQASVLVTNTAASPVELSIRAVTAAEFPETIVIPAMAAGMIGLVGLYLALQFFAPKVGAIALATSKEAIAQPIFYISLALGAFALLAFVFVPYFTLGDDVKILKDSGLTLIMVLAILIALWTASVSVAEEIEGRTALTVLSKPIGRSQFVIGKFLGINMAVAVMFVILGVLFLATISYKVVYDARESAQQDPTWRMCYVEMAGIVPGLVLAYMETIVLTAISVAISTRLPMLANLIICSSVYVLGHLVPMLVASSVGRDFPIVKFVGQFFATVLPVLEHFNIYASVAAGAVVPLTYLAWALLYCLLYSTIAMLLALLMFEDRDLA